jgi:hypothetical protein
VFLDPDPFFSQVLSDELVCVLLKASSLKKNSGYKNFSFEDLKVKRGLYDELGHETVIILSGGATTVLIQNLPVIIPGRSAKTRKHLKLR